VAGLEDAMSIGQRIQQERESAQVSLFGTAEIVSGNGNGKARLPEIPEWDEKLLLNFEKEALGFYITGHPLSRHLSLMKRFVTADTSILADLQDKSEVKLCGLVGNLKEILTKKNERMGFVVIEDLTGSVEVVVLPDVYSSAADCLKGEEPILVSGILEVGEKGAKIRATEVSPLRAVQERDTRSVHYTLTTAALERWHLEELKTIIGRYHGPCRSILHLAIPSESRTTIMLPETLNVSACEELALAVRELIGYNAVTFE
jgi:DNA polymerase-3 subunit alpha